MSDQERFFRSVLSEQGKPCLAWLVQGNPKPYFKHKVFDTIDDLLEALGRINFTTYNYYFCVSTLRERSVTDGDKNRVRTQKNTELTRCFVLDVDIRPDEEDHYHTFDEAYEGVEQVRTAFNLPQPIIVNSGFGLHVYWPMADGIESKTWVKFGQKFKRAIQFVAPKVVADGTRVADSAGVLRVPLSFNLKSEPPTAVEIVQWHDDFLDFSTFSATLSRLVKDENETRTVDIGTTVYESGPVELSGVAKKCAWVRAYLKDKASASEPEWYAVLGLAPYMVHTKPDGTQLVREKVAHALSNGHPGYDPEATYLKYIQVSTAQTGPTTCARFASINPARCEGCPFRGSIKTPLQVAALDVPATAPVVVEAATQDEEGNTAVEEVTIPLPPEPYFRGENGGVFVRTKVKNEEGGWDSIIQRIYDYDFYPVKRLRTEATESEATECHLWLPQDGLKKFRLPSGLLAESKKLNTFLSDKGVVAEFNKAAGVTKYLVDYIRFLQMNNRADIEFSRFGWRDALSADPKFVVSNGYYDRAGTLVKSGVAANLKEAAKAISERGSISKWKEGFNVYNHVPNSDPYILASLLGFAAPLMALTEYSGVLYNIVGHSAAGKSTALKLMTSVWGEPNPEHILINDTDNAIYNFIGYLSSIPVAFDEITNMEPLRLSSFLLSFTGGRGKMRATRDGQNRTNEVFWDTIICSTSNSWLYTKLMEARQGYNAEQTRVFELEVQPSQDAYRGIIDRSIQLVNENYGIAGRTFLEYIIPRLTKIKPMLDQAHATVMSMGLRNHERFWGAMLSCVLVSGKIARDKLHLHDYDVEGLVHRLVTGVERVRANMASSASEPVSIIAEFLNTNLGATLRFKDGQIDLATLNNNLNAVKIRMEAEGGIVVRAFISTQALKEYCQTRRIDFGWLRRELSDAGVLTNMNLQKRLTTGSNLPAVNAKCWELNMTHTRIVGVLDQIETTE